MSKYQSKINSYVVTFAMQFDALLRRAVHIATKYFVVGGVRDRRDRFLGNRAHV